MRTYRNPRSRTKVTALLIGLTALPVFADEEKNKTESNSTSSSASKIEVRVQSNRGKVESDADNKDEQVTVVVGVAGDQPEVVKKSIEKLESQLKTSGIPESLQKKALDALKAQAEKPVGSGNAVAGVMSWSSSDSDTQEPSKNSSSTQESNDASKGKTQARRFEMRLPFDPTSRFPNPMVNAFSVSNTMRPGQQEKLRQGIRNALVEAGVDAEIVEKALKGVDKTLNEWSSQNNFSIRTSNNLPYRIGLGCKPKEEGDSQPGLEVETVFEDSPAAKAGLKAGDRLISIDSQPIRSHEDIVAAVQKAGEEKRMVQIETKRGDEAIEYEIKPHQTAVADLNIDFMQPGGKLGFSFPGPAWVMGQPPFDGNQLWNDPKFQERMRDAMKDAMDAARRATNEMDHSRGRRKESLSSEPEHDRNMDEMKSALKDVQKELQELKESLKKLSEKP